MYTYGSQVFPSSPFNYTNYWVDVNFSPSSGGTAELFSLFTPGTIDSGPDSQVELGLQFESSAAGSVKGIRFYKSAANTGTHIGNLWTAAGSNIGTVTFTGETASGWQEKDFATPIAILPNTIYVASYNTSVGHEATDRNYFKNCRTNGPLYAPGLNGCTVATGPDPTPSPITYSLTSACINNLVYTNTLLPTSGAAPDGEGEFDLDGLDSAYWGGTKERIESVNVAGDYTWGPGYYSSWGRHQYDTWFSDPSDGKSLPNPIVMATDSGVSPSVQSLRLMASIMPSPAPSNVAGADYYAADVETELNNAQYGFFVARERLPAYMPAISPAFWMLEEDVPQAGGAQDDEQDIQEMFANINGNALNANQIVWNNAYTTVPEGVGMYTFPGTPQSAYHDYGVLLSPQGASFYLDGTPIPGDWGLPDHTAGGKDKEIMLMFQVGAPGSFLDPSSIGASNPWPVYWYVQWVRAYAPTATSCTPAPSPSPSPSVSPSPSPSPSPSASSGIPSYWYGVTDDESGGSSSSLASALSGFGTRMVTRIVYDGSGWNAASDATRTAAFEPYSAVMGLLYDSGDITSSSPTLSTTTTVTNSYLAQSQQPDIYEIGNEVNGTAQSGGWLSGCPANTGTNWTTSTPCVSLYNNMFTLAHNAGKKTALTFYYETSPGTGYDITGWAARLALSFPTMASGLDYVLISYYEVDNGNTRIAASTGCPQCWNTIFTALHTDFPNAKLGFGEIGLDCPYGLTGSNCSNTGGPNLATTEDIMQYYMKLNVTVSGATWIGGDFWWYWGEDYANSSLEPYLKAIVTGGPY